MAVEEILSLRALTRFRLITYITELAPWTQQSLQLPYSVTMYSLFLFYPALPIALAGRDEDLLGICRHAPIQVLVALDLETGGHLAALACRRRTCLYDWKGSRGASRVRDLDLRSFERVPSPGDPLRQSSGGRRGGAPAAVAENKHSARDGDQTKGVKMDERVARNGRRAPPPGDALRTSRLGDSGNTREAALSYSSASNAN